MINKLLVHYYWWGRSFSVHRNKLGCLHADICDITNVKPILVQYTNTLRAYYTSVNVEIWNFQHTEKVFRVKAAPVELWWSGPTLENAVNMSDCAVLGCKPVPGASIHNLPRDPVLKQKWIDFIYRHRLSRPSNTVGIRICGAHFTNDCFVNFFQRSMGFATKLILKPDAVPCIYPGNSTGLKHVSVYFTGRSF